MYTYLLMCNSYNRYVCMSAMSALKTNLFIFYIAISIAYNKKLRIIGAIYIKIKKFIIYSIYFADMQTFCKKALFYAVLLCLHMSAKLNFLRLHQKINADMQT